MITRFSYTLFAILYCFCGAITNTCHTVSTLIPPYRLSVFKYNVILWAVFNTLTASDTSIICLKCSSFHEELIKNRIYRTTHKTVVEIVSWYRERLFCFNTGNGIHNSRLSIFYNFSCFLCLGCICLLYTSPSPRD